ncbi:hypothetical protein GCM10027299_21360 [Larkinella ripae]
MTVTTDAELAAAEERPVYRPSAISVIIRLDGMEAIPQGFIKERVSQAQLMAIGTPYGGLPVDVQLVGELKAIKPAWLHDSRHWGRTEKQRTRRLVRAVIGKG